MPISPEVVTAVFQGLVLLLGTLGTFLAVVGRRSGVRARDYNAARRRLQIALAYIFLLGDELAERGIPVPARPAGLDVPDDDEPPSEPRHRADSAP